MGECDLSFMGSSWVKTYIFIFFPHLSFQWFNPRSLILYISLSASSLFIIFRYPYVVSLIFCGHLLSLSLILLLFFYYYHLLSYFMVTISIFFCLDYSSPTLDDGVPSYTYKRGSFQVWGVADGGSFLVIDSSNRFLFISSKSSIILVGE